MLVGASRVEVKGGSGPECAGAGGGQDRGEGTGEGEEVVRREVRAVGECHRSAIRLLAGAWEGETGRGGCVEVGRVERVERVGDSGRGGVGCSRVE